MTPAPGVICTNPHCDEGTAAAVAAPKCEMASRCVEACAAYGRVCPCGARAAGKAAFEALTKLRENSAVFPSVAEDADPSCHMLKLNADDLVIGEKLGEGGYSQVNACMLKTDPDKPLAIKYLKRKVMVNQRNFEHGAADLAQEAHFLSVLDHPHIISLHGVTAGSVQTNVSSGKECGFFITVDRLFDTLEKRLEVWRSEQGQTQQGIFTRYLSSDYKESKRQELRERIKIAYDIADAVEYLHNKNIIFRDLKPDNIGWSKDGELKIFDFGLAKELKPGEGNPDGRYELTGNTGSRRYMAPEVAKELPYNKSVDAYSFGILLWEILTAEKPFYGYSSGRHMSLVVMGGERPKMDSSRTAYWPMNLQWLMKRCWSPFPQTRPDFATIKQTLQDVLDCKDCIPDLSNLGTQTNQQPASADKAERKVEPLSGGFASFLKPRRVKAKSQGYVSPSTQTQSLGYVTSSTQTPAVEESPESSSSSNGPIKGVPPPIPQGEPSKKRASSFGWMFRK